MLSRCCEISSYSRTQTGDLGSSLSNLQLAGTTHQLVAGCFLVPRLNRMPFQRFVTLQGDDVALRMCLVGELFLSLTSHLDKDGVPQQTVSLFLVVKKKMSIVLFKNVQAYKGFPVNVDILMHIHTYIYLYICIYVCTTVWYVNRVHDFLYTEGNDKMAYRESRI